MSLWGTLRMFCSLWMMWSVICNQGSIARSWQGDDSICIKCFSVAVGILPRLFIHKCAYIVTCNCILLLFCSPNNIQRQFTCTVTENEILLLFQQLIEKNYLKISPISDWRFVAEPWLTHILISKVRRDICKERKSYTLLFFLLKTKQLHWWALLIFIA